MGDEGYLVLASIKIWSSWESCSALQQRVALPRVILKDPTSMTFIYISGKSPLQFLTQDTGWNRGSSSFSQLLKTPNWHEQP